MIISFTSHRPDKLGGYKLPNPIYNHVCQQIEKLLLELKPDTIISGMCIGGDLYAANIAIKLNIPLIAAIPFIGQELAWNTKDQKIYHKPLNKASKQIIVSEGSYAGYKMQNRNKYLVDNCDILIALFDPIITSGGTFNCIQYAKLKNRQTIFINPRLDNII